MAAASLGSRRGDDKSIVKAFQETLNQRRNQDAAASPSLPMASTGQPSRASMQRAISSSVVGCLKTKECPPSSCRVKNAGAVSRHKSQSMHCVSTKNLPAMLVPHLSALLAMSGPKQAAIGSGVKPRALKTDLQRWPDWRARRRSADG